MSNPDNFCHADSLFTDAFYVYAGFLNDASGRPARILYWLLRIVWCIHFAPAMATRPVAWSAFVDIGTKMTDTAR
jgi:hypothetical protein